MEDLTRRRAAAVIAGAGLITWLGAGRRAQASARKLRAGAELTLRCPGATAFELTFEGYGEARVPAKDGVATFRVPFPVTAREWTPLACTPCDARGPLGPSTAVQILTAPIQFGA